MTEQTGTHSDDNEWVIDNLPNRITIFRILLIPVIILSLGLNLIPGDNISQYYHLTGWIASLTFCVAAITDFFDGYIARKRDIVTVFGSFLDPIADKFLVVSGLILLQGLERIPAIIVIVLVLREMYITSLRLLAKERGLSVPVAKLGKYKTATQMVAIPLLMAYDKDLMMPFIGTVLIYLASFFSLLSALQYSLGLMNKIRSAKKKKKEEKSASLS